MPGVLGIRAQLNLLKAAVPLKFFDVVICNSLHGAPPVLAYCHHSHRQYSLHFHPKKHLSPLKRIEQSRYAI